jgi:hypothetical protein
MKKVIAVIIVAIALQSCGINKGLTNCQYAKTKLCGYR